MKPTSGKHFNAYQVAALCFLLIVLSLQLFFSVRRESQTWDEGNHIFTGYRSWTHGDYGLNPEHPPLVKLFVTIPLLWSQPKSPVLEERFFKEDAFLRGKEFLYQNDPEKILSRTRTFAAILTLLTALVVFFGAREMFGTGAAFIALTLLAFDPNLLAHGALITTDVGLACFMFLSVYIFYRFVKSPSALRLIAAGVSVGLVLAAKHTGLLVLPILFLLVLCEIIFNEKRGRRVLQLLGSLALIALIGWVVLWSTYRFRYDARPNGLQLNPPLAAYVEGLKPHEAWPIRMAARFHILPESYLYGLVDVKLTANYYTSYVLGKVYAHNVWFYFPVAFLIKSTVDLSGVEFGPGSLDPYGQFKLLKPTAVIDNGVFVFDGTFDMPLAAAISKVQKARNLVEAKQLDQALQEAQAAVAFAPDSIQTQLALGDILREMGKPEQARPIYEKALQLAKSIEPEFQIRSIPNIEQRLQSLATAER